jgi:p-methyltransferase
VPQPITALFIPYYYDADRWHNDAAAGHGGGAESRARGKSARKARMTKEGVTVDGRLLDLARLLSDIRYGTTAEYERYDSYSLTLLAGSYYLSFLRRNGVDVHVANSCSRYSLERLAARVEPRFVLLSTTLILENLILRDAIKRIRDAWPETIVVVGGLFLVEMQKTNPPDKFDNLLRSYGADVYVVSPRAECVVLDLLRCDSKRALLEKRLPATYIVDGRTVHPPDTLADTDLTMAEMYVRWGEHVPTDHLYHTVHTRTARSCAFVCAFCNFPVNQGPLTLMPVDAFERELRLLQRVGTVKSLIFTDDTFNVPQRRFKDLCRMMAKFDFEWYSFFRPQFADPETVRLMKEAHCRGVFLGIESADDQILRNMNKAATVTAFKRGITELRRHDIRMHANFVVGFPGDTPDTSRKLVDFLDDTGIEFFTLAPFYYVHSTPIHQRAAEFGLEGAFERWRHDTMTSEQAFALTAELKRAPKYAIHAPELAANNFWTEIMFYANGWTVDEARSAFRLFNRFEGMAVTAAELRAAPEYSGVAAALQRRPMPRPVNC